MIRVRTLPLAVAVFVLIFGGIQVAVVSGNWKTTSSKEPAKFKTGELAGLPNPSDIRGSYTWQDIEKAFGVSAKETAALFSAPGFELNPSERVSALETFYKGRLPADKEVGTDSVRLFVSRMTGLPHAPEEGTALPAAAVAYLESVGKADPVVQAAKLDASIFKAAAAAAPAVSTAAAPIESDKNASAATEAHVESERKVGGSTTFGALRSWGLSDAEIEKTLGFKPGTDGSSVRDAVQAAGKTFSELKTELQKLVDSKAK